MNRLTGEPSGLWLYSPPSRGTAVRVGSDFFRQFSLNSLLVDHFMPNTGSATRALRKDERRRVRNKQQRSALRTTIKKVRASAAAVPTGEKSVDDAKSALLVAVKKLDQSAAKHLIHRNKAARDKSRLTKLINKLSAPKPTEGAVAT